MKALRCLPGEKISINRDLTPSNREELKGRSYVSRQTAQARTDSTTQVDFQRLRLIVTSKAYLKNKSSATYIFTLLQKNWHLLLAAIQEIEFFCKAV